MTKTYAYQVEGLNGWRTVAVGLDTDDCQTLINNRARFVRQESGAYPLDRVRFVEEK